MTNIANTYILNDYDPEIALKLLGPSNFGPSEPQNCCDSLLLIVKQIAVFILRVFNLICGDHQWYTNATARQMVDQYYSNPERDPSLDQKMKSLYDALLLRANGNVSLAEGIQIHQEFRVLNNIELAAKQLRELSLSNNRQAQVHPSIFFNANELGASRVMNVLKDQSFKENRCHFGVSGLFNWNIAVSTKPEAILMVDINPKTVKFNQMALETLLKSVNGHDFAYSLAARCFEENDFDYSHYRGRHCLGSGRSVDSTTYVHKNRSAENDRWFSELFDKTFNGPFSVFEKEESFQYLKQMAQENRIIILQGDLTDHQRTQQIMNIVQGHGLHFGTIYLSNAFEWINKFTPQKNSMYLENIHKLASFEEGINPDTTIIDGLASPYKQGNFYDIQLNIFYAEDPASHERYHPEQVRNIKDGIFNEDLSQRAEKHPSAPLLIELGNETDEILL